VQEHLLYGYVYIALFNSEIATPFLMAHGNFLLSVLDQKVGMTVGDYQFRPVGGLA